MLEQTPTTLGRLKNGKHGVFQFGQMVGTIDHGHLIDYVKKAHFEEQAVPMSDGKQALSSGASASVDRAVVEGTGRLMREEFLPYKEALKKLLAADRGLAERYKKAHTKEMANYPS